METTSIAVTTPFDEMERADEQMVLEEIKGRAIDTLVYEVRGVTGLSLAGVRETARVMNSKSLARIKVSDKEPVVIETDDYFEVRAYGVDEMNGGGNWGIKRQAKRYDDGKPNTFAYEQALAKAQRNALRGLIPEWFVKQMIDAWRQRGNVRVINGNGQNGQAAASKARHWALDKAQYARFMAEAQRLEMDKGEILGALNVEKSIEFKGTVEDAIKQLREFRLAHPRKQSAMADGGIDVETGEIVEPASS